MTEVLGFHRSVARVQQVIDLGGDAAYPPPPVGQYPASVTVGAFYIGGDTPHVWTVEQINEMASGVHYLLPIYVRSDPFQVDPVVDAQEALLRLEQIGAPPTCRICLDVETAVDSEYCQVFRNKIASHKQVVYGSVGTVLGNRWPYNWVADPGATIPALFDSVEGRQFAWDAHYDLTWWNGAFVSRSFWRTELALPA